MIIAANTIIERKKQLLQCLAAVDHHLSEVSIF
jgi:hypothetical protein